MEARTINYRIKITVFYHVLATSAITLNPKADQKININEIRSA